RQVKASADGVGDLGRLPCAVNCHGGRVPVGVHDGGQIFDPAKLVSVLEFVNGPVFPVNAVAGGGYGQDCAAQNGDGGVDVAAAPLDIEREMVAVRHDEREDARRIELIAVVETAADAERPGRHGHGAEGTIDGDSAAPSLNGDIRGLNDIH